MSGILHGQGRQWCGDLARELQLPQRPPDLAVPVKQRTWPNIQHLFSLGRDLRDGVALVLQLGDDDPEFACLDVSGLGRHHAGKLARQPRGSPGTRICCRRAGGQRLRALAAAPFGCAGGACTRAASRLRSAELVLEVSHLPPACPQRRLPRLLGSRLALSDDHVGQPRLQNQRGVRAPEVPALRVGDGHASRPGKRGLVDLHGVCAEPDARLRVVSRQGDQIFERGDRTPNLRLQPPMQRGRQLLRRNGPFGEPSEHPQLKL
mmetsp:Transcript_143867/g.460558  ORF Transcript_143867/g.460558 Transcript_143867/m.460558 type:complete len:263 (-) Transcript_143867:1831-2619(-)